MEIEYEEPAQYTEEEMKTWMDDQIHDMLLQYYNVIDNKKDK